MRIALAALCLLGCSADSLGLPDADPTPPADAGADHLGSPGPEAGPQDGAQGADAAQDGPIADAGGPEADPIDASEAEAIDAGPDALAEAAAAYVACGLPSPYYGKSTWQGCNGVSSPAAIYANLPDGGIVSCPAFSPSAVGDCPSGTECSVHYSGDLNPPAIGWCL